MTRDQRSPRVPRQWIVGALLRLYPAAWRSEYGPELTGILLERPLSARVLADVVSNGLWQRARGAEPSTILGLASMFILLTGLVMSGGRYGGDALAVLRPSSTTFPTVTFTFFANEFYVLLLAGCGYWTYRRHAGKPSRCGVAAMRMSLIAGIPVMVIALLMVFGLVDLMPLDPDGAARMRPSAWAILAAPLARVPEAWIWGSLGGLLGKCLARRRQAPSATGVRS